MNRIRIYGENPLHGTISITGAKNAALPLMAASLLTDDVLHLDDVPQLADVDTLEKVLKHHGVTTQRTWHNEDMRLSLKAERIIIDTMPKSYDLVRKMRASVLILGPLLARTGRACVSLPGGCAIGLRPIDLHLSGLTQMGVEIDVIDGNINARAPRGLHGAEIVFPTISVGATENLLMAATLAHGTTVLINVAREPEIIDLANCLVAMGAQITGIGTDCLIIQGQSRLHGTVHRILPDRIETATYAIAAAMTNGSVELINIQSEFLKAVLILLKESGVTVELTQRGLKVSKNRDDYLKGVDVLTEPFPGFPTDLQAQIMALMTIAQGAAMITETIFENRFMHVPELKRMGANITVHHASALVRGVPYLTGAPVMATDLRASVALVLAGLTARGMTEIHRIYHLQRGYANLITKLANCGAHIEEITGDYP